jgi:hypothetical protein
VYAVYDFDGFHVDQLGDWGTTYNSFQLAAGLATVPVNGL